MINVEIFIGDERFSTLVARFNRLRNYSLALARSDEFAAEEGCGPLLKRYLRAYKARNKISDEMGQIVAINALYFKPARKAS